jgi:hypothetical protein
VNDSSCAFCDAELRGNKIAFDPARGRLWEVCGLCGQWNISSLEADERSRTIERLEFEFRAASEHGGTKSIGVARLGGVTLVRIGDASWREFAAWRYGRRLRSRLTLARVGTWVGIAIWVWFSGFSPSDYVKALPAVPLIYGLLWVHKRWSISHWTVVRTRTPEGHGDILRWSNVRKAELLRDGDSWDSWKLAVPHRDGASVFRGERAVRMLGAITPLMHPRGAGDALIGRAIALIEREGGPDRVFMSLAKEGSPGENAKNQIRFLRPEESLALEMCAHEAQERRAFIGEVSALTRDWNRAAEMTEIVERL